MIIQLIILKLFLKNKYLFLVNLNNLYYHSYLLFVIIILETYKHFIFDLIITFQIIIIYYYSFHLFNNYY